LPRHRKKLSNQQDSSDDADSNLEFEQGQYKKQDVKKKVLSNYIRSSLE
jgi:hypothetical protein